MSVEIKKYFSIKLMKRFLNQRVIETVNRSIEELGLKISKRTLNNKRLVILAFVLANIELPLPLRFIKLLLKGYITGVVNRVIDDLIKLLIKPKNKKK